MCTKTPFIYSRPPIRRRRWADVVYILYECFVFTQWLGGCHSMTMLGTHHLISGGGGGPRVFVACKLFFYLRWKTSFFLAINVRQFFFMLCRRFLLLYAFPIMYVTIWCFFWSTYFSSISSTNFFFLLTFSTNFFFWLLWRQTIFFNFNLPPPPRYQMVRPLYRV